LGAGLYNRGMGKSVVATNLLSRAKGFWGWFIKKSPAFIVLTSLTVVSVFGLGVGGTLAATGVIPNPFVSAAPLEPTDNEDEQTYAPEGGGSLPKDFDGIEKIEDVFGSCYNRATHTVDSTDSVDDSCLGISEKRTTSLMASGWTGVKFSFVDGGYHYIFAAVPVGGTTDTPTFVSIEVSVNGGPPTRGGFCYHYGYGVEGKTCGMESFGLMGTAGSYGTCLPGGDTYLVEIKGHGLNFRETGVIPERVFNCPSVSPTPTTQTSPTPTPTSDTSPTPTTEPSPTPSAETSPTPTTEPSPTPTSP
jgi:hypothetical protein